MNVQFVIYNSPKEISGLEQRIMLLDELGKTLMSATLPVNRLSSGPSAQAVQATRLKVPATRGRYAVVVTLQGAKGKSMSSAARILWSNEPPHLLIGLLRILSFHETLPRWVAFRISRISE